MPNIFEDISTGLQELGFRISYDASDVAHFMEQYNSSAPGFNRKEIRLSEDIPDVAKGEFVQYLLHGFGIDFTSLVKENHGNHKSSRLLLTKMTEYTDGLFPVSEVQSGTTLRFLINNTEVKVNWDQEEFNDAFFEPINKALSINNVPYRWFIVESIFKTDQAGYFTLFLPLYVLNVLYLKFGNFNGYDIPDFYHINDDNIIRSENFNFCKKAMIEINPKK